MTNGGAVSLISHCQSCGSDVSTRAFSCRSCGQFLNDVVLSITLELIESLRDEDLADVFFQYVTAEMGLRGCFQFGGPSDRSVLLEMPSGLRAGWSLVVLDSEVLNGGFQQWFANSSGKTTDFALEALRSIGSQTFFKLVADAVKLNEQLESAHPTYAMRFEGRESLRNLRTAESLWRDFDAHYEPEFNRLTEEYYRLLKADPFYALFAEYVRRCPEQCVHDRSGTTRPGP